MNRLYNNWVLLERYETQLVKQVDDTKFYANMIVHYKMPAVQESLSKSLPDMIANTGAICDEMHAIVDGLEAGDIAGVTKEEVKAALVAYEEAVAVVQDQANKQHSWIW